METKYVNVDNNKLMTVQDVLSSGGNNAVPLNLAPFKLNDNASTVDILSELLKAFYPSFSNENNQAICNEVQTKLKKKNIVTLTKISANMAVAETYQEQSLTEYDLGISLFLAIQAKIPTQSIPILVEDPRLLVALAAQLPDDSRLFGVLTDINELPSILQVQIAEVQTHPNCSVVCLTSDQVPDNLQQNLMTGLSKNKIFMLNDNSLPLIIAQIIKLIKLSQVWTEENSELPFHLTMTTTNFANVLALRYAQQFGFYPKGEKVSVAIINESKLGDYLNGGVATIDDITFRNIRRLDLSINQNKETIENLAIVSELAEFVETIFIDHTKIISEIRRLQTQFSISCGPEAASASLAASQQPKLATVLIAPNNPYQNPEAILIGITNRDDGKRDFEAVQILRQIIDLAAPRLITHLKAQKLAPVILNTDASLTRFIKQLV